MVSVGTGVASNSILCVECLRWVHKRCSGIKGKLKSNVDFRCRRCLEESPVGTVLQREVEIEPTVKLECVIKFCYLGDTLGAGGGADEAARAKMRFDWAKFKELSPILTASSSSFVCSLNPIRQTFTPQPLFHYSIILSPLFFTNVSAPICFELRTHLPVE